VLPFMLWIASAALSPGNFCILSAEERGTSLAILKPSGALQARVEVGAWPHEVEVGADGQTAYVSQFGITDYDSRIGTPGDHVSRIDLKSARETGRYKLPDGLRGPHGVKLRPGTRELFVNAESGGDTMLVYDAETLQLLRSFPIGKGSHNFVFSATGASLYVFAGLEGVAKYDATNGSILATQLLPTPVRGLRLASDGTIVAAAKGQVAILGAKDLRVRRLLPAPVMSQFVYLETLPGGAIIAPTIVDNGVVWFDANKPPRFIGTGKGALSVRLAPDGNLYVANVDDDHFTVLSTTGEVLGQVGRGLAGPNGLAFGTCPEANANAERG